MDSDAESDRGLPNDDLRLHQLQRVRPTLRVLMVLDSINLGRRISMTENITPAQQAMEAWHGKVKLDRAVMLELYLDKLTLAEGSVRGVAFLRDAEQLTPLAVNGKLRG